MELSEQDIRRIVRKELVKAFQNNVIRSPNGSIKISGNENSVSITVNTEEVRQAAREAAPVTVQANVFDNVFS